MILGDRTMATRPTRPIRIAGDGPPDRSPTSVVGRVLVVGEAVALWQLTRLAEVLWLRWLAWTLLGFVVVAAVARPWARRRVHAVSMARWRALRRLRRIEPADFGGLTQLQTSAQDKVTFNLGVLAVTQRIGDVIAEEERLAGVDVRDGVV